MTVDEKLDLIVNEISNINAKLNGIDDRLNGFDDKFDELQDDINIIKADVKTIKKHVHFNRQTETDIIDYIEKRVDEKLEQFKQELHQSA